MRDPHVASLTYKLRTPDSIEFEDPPPLEHETDDFKLRLEGGILKVEMKRHFSSEVDARSIVDEYLLSWEIEVALRYGSTLLHFAFDKADLIDRNPPRPGTPREVVFEATGGAVFGGKAIVIGTYRAYPSPPARFSLSQDVRSMWQRYQEYTNNREKLTSMAYFCLTVLEASAGGRKQAAKQYRIDEEVLRTLGRVASRRGNELQARKLVPGVKPTPLTSREEWWIREVVRRLIHRKGECDFDPSAPLQPITMKDLPGL